MGNNSSLELGPTEGEADTSSLGHVWLEFVRGDHVPGSSSSGFSCSASSAKKSDPFVRAWLEGKDGVRKSSKVESQTCKATKSPIWKSTRRLDVWPAPQGDDTLVVELMDASPVTSNRKTGTVRVQLVDLPNEPTKFGAVLESDCDSEGPECSITFRRCCRCAAVQCVMLLLLQARDAEGGPGADLSRATCPICLEPRTGQTTTRRQRTSNNIRK